MSGGRDNLFNIFRLTNKLTSLGHEVPKRLKNVINDTLVELNKEINTYTQVNGHVRGQHKGLSEQTKELQAEINTMRDQVQEANNAKAATQATASQTVAELRRQAEQVEGEYLNLQRQLQRCQAELSAAHDVADSAQAARAIAEVPLEALRIQSTENADVPSMMSGEQVEGLGTAVTNGSNYEGNQEASDPSLSTPRSTNAMPTAENNTDHGPVNAKKRKLNHDQDAVSAEAPKFVGGETFFQQTLSALAQSGGQAQPKDNQSLPGASNVLNVTDAEMEEFKLFDEEDEL